jgi:hypothetical protein
VRNEHRTDSNDAHHFGGQGTSPDRRRFSREIRPRLERIAEGAPCESCGQPATRLIRRNEEYRTVCGTCSGRAH